MGTLKKVTKQVADAVAKVQKSTLKSYSKYSPYDRDLSSRSKEILEKLMDDFK